MDELAIAGRIIGQLEGALEKLIRETEKFERDAPEPAKGDAGVDYRRALDSLTSERDAARKVLRKAQTAWDEAAPADSGDE